MTESLSMLLAAGTPESFLVLLAILLLSALSSWLRRRNQQTDDESWAEPADTAPAPPARPIRPAMTESAPPPTLAPQPTRTGAPAPTPAQTPPRRLTDWEQELRRLLGEEPISTAPSPPIIPTELPRPTPAAPTRPVPSRPAPGPVRSPAPPVVRRIPTPIPVPIPSSPAAEAEVPLREPGLAQLKASQIGQFVADRMRKVDERTHLHLPAAAPARIKERSAEMSELVNWIRRPESARRAIIAATIFGPPKAL